MTIIIKHNLFVKDIIQIYVQSKIFLNKDSLIRSFFELDLSKNSIFRIVQFLYNVLETKTHGFNIYQNHHKKKLLMIKLTFDSCLLHIKFVEFIFFEVVNIQINDTLIFSNDEFVTLKENELTHVHLTFKKREKLNLNISIKINN